MTQSLRIEHGVAVITGAASGIGAALARRAAELGMQLVLADWNQQDLVSLGQSLPGRVETVVTDVSRESDVANLADIVFDRFGDVDLVFNNAGVLSSGRSWELDLATWDRSMAVNVRGVVNGIRSFVPRLIDAGRPAQIINTASVGGFFSSPLMGPYSASKFAVVAITEGLAMELDSIGSAVGASLLAPGAVKTQILDEAAPRESTKLIDRMRAMTSERGAEPSDVARYVFEKLQTREFWLVPQPESLDQRVRARAEMILHRRSPVPAK